MRMKCNKHIVKCNYLTIWERTITVKVVIGWYTGVDSLSWGSHTHCACSSAWKAASGSLTHGGFWNHKDHVLGHHDPKHAGSWNVDCIQERIHWRFPTLARRAIRLSQTGSFQGPRWNQHIPQTHSFAFQISGTRILLKETSMVEMALRRI